MTHDEQLIEQIVRSVLNRLQASGGRKPPDAPGTPNDSITITEKVITGNILESQVNGSKVITIAQRAVLTPSARDIIRQRNITIDRQKNLTSTATAASRWMAIVVRSTPALETAIDDAIGAGFIDTRELVDGNDEAAQMAVNHICRADADGVIVFSEHSHLVACLANRNRSVRAAIADNAATVKAVSAAMAANVFCINPVDQSYFGLRNILRQLPTGG